MSARVRERKRVKRSAHEKAHSSMKATTPMAATNDDARAMNIRLAKARAHDRGAFIAAVTAVAVVAAVAVVVDAAACALFSFFSPHLGGKNVLCASSNNFEPKRAAFCASFARAPVGRLRAVAAACKHFFLFWRLELSATTATHETRPPPPNKLIFAR